MGRYDPATLERGVFEMVQGPGQGVLMALKVIDAVRHEFPIDGQRTYVTGQSMGGAGTWNMSESSKVFCRSGNLLRKYLERRWHCID
jgi:dienelactone hydrolase